MDNKVIVDGAMARALNDAFFPNIRRSMDSGSDMAHSNIQPFAANKFTVKT